MKRRNIFILSCVFAGLVTAPTARGGWIDVNLAPDYWEYRQTYPDPNYPTGEGYLKNTTINGKGACSATSMINSFWYLQNKFPTVYTTGHKLIPDGNLPDARNSLHKRIWGLDNSGGYTSDIWEEKIKWFEEFDAPGVFKGMIDESVEGWYKPEGLVGNTFPTFDFLWTELSHKEDVEIFVHYEDPCDPNLNWGHALTLTSLHFLDDNNDTKWNPGAGEKAKIDYLDNNTPWKFTTKELTLTDSKLYFPLYDDNVYISGAFSESVPESATVVLLALGSLVLLRRRKG